MPTHSLSSAEVLALLAAGPPRTALSAEMALEQLQAAPASGEWSANEVLAHLRACADMWGGAIGAILANDHPTLRAVNPRNWVSKTDYCEQPFRPSLAAFTAQRTELLAVLEPLAPEG